jgi:hypothetical protein
VQEPLGVLREPPIEREKQAQQPQVSLRRVESPLLDVPGKAVPLMMGLPVGLKVLPAE